MESVDLLHREQLFAAHLLEESVHFEARNRFLLECARPHYFLAALGLDSAFPLLVWEHDEVRPLFWVWLFIGIGWRRGVWYNSYLKSAVLVSVSTSPFLGFGAPVAI